MALADPQSVTIGATTSSLPRTGSGMDSGQWSSADGAVKLRVSSLFGKRTRRTVRIDWTRTAPDPLVPAVNTVSSASVYVVLDVPKAGFSATEQADLVKGLAAYLSASTYAVVPKFVGGES